MLAYRKQQCFSQGQPFRLREKSKSAVKSVYVGMVQCARVDQYPRQVPRNDTGVFELDVSISTVNRRSRADMACYGGVALRKRPKFGLKCIPSSQRPSMTAFPPRADILAPGAVLRTPRAVRTAVRRLTNSATNKVGNFPNSQNFLVMTTVEWELGNRGCVGFEKSAWCQRDALYRRSVLPDS